MTKQEALALARFGCTLRQDILCIDLPGVSREKALAANILIRSIYEDCPGGPLFCLGFEISPTPALPRYCYLPCNPKDRVHKNYLASLAQTGLLRLCFLIEGDTVRRDYPLTASQRRRMMEFSSEALRTSKARKGYSFTNTVEYFGQAFRIPQFFERGVSDTELAEVLEKVKAKAEAVSPEKRALAHQITRGIAAVLKNRMGPHIRKHMESVKNMRRGTLLLFDMEREFRDDFDRCVDYVADTVALSMEEEPLRRSTDWPSKLDSLFKVFEQLSSAPETEQDKIRTNLIAAGSQALSTLAGGRGLSLAILQNLLLQFRPLLSGTPGRPTKDYSKEYEWKASGLSWTKVARQSLMENPEIREEFGGRDLDSLTFEQKELLRNRIRAGVTSYAERIGKPLPIKVSGATRQSHRPAGNQ